MNSYDQILDKLNEFSQKYYTRMLLKGILLFFTLGLLIFLLVTSLEYFLWLSSTGRLILLVLFVMVEVFLLYRYIMVPLLFLFKIKQGITNKDASVLIGKHFSQVGDKLSNLLDLAQNREKSELVLASMEQRSSDLSPIPFSRAIDFRDSLKHAKYLLIPLALILVLALSGKAHTFFGSADRVVNYKMAFEPPAPFSFKVNNKSLSILDNESLTIEVITIGNVQPKDVVIVVDGNEHLMRKDNGRYLFAIPAPVRASNFYLSSGQVRSKTYRVTVLETPAINDFGLHLKYPTYLNKTTEIINGTGNATIPEGTQISWQINAANTDFVELIARDTILDFQREEQKFSLKKSIYSQLPYEIAVSNKNANRFERLSYRIQVIKDEAPSLSITEVKDSLNPNIYYYSGEAADDYSLKHIGLVVYPVDDPEQTQKISIDEPRANFAKFFYTFPSGLDLKPNQPYEFYFTAKDNDGLRGGKTVKSRVFNRVLLGQNQIRNEELKTQESLIQKLDNSLEFSKEQKKALKEINTSNKEKSELNFNDQNQVKEYLERQQQQERQMEKFSKQLNDNLEKLDHDSPMSKMLQERLERQELEAKKNQKLIEELNKIADKIKKDELAKRLDELSKNQQNNERNLAQLLELMKRFYVEEKAEHLAVDLKKLAERQEQISDGNLRVDSLKKGQDDLNKAFDKLSKELEDLKNDNKKLQKPLSIEVGTEESELVKEELRDALKSIEEQQEKDKSDNRAQKKQKSAAKRMNEMSAALSRSSASGGGSSDTEDAEMLRQILDNLVTFSFKQEGLYDSLEENDGESAQFSASIKEQQRLRELFEHVDDSIFSLSLRRAELSEFVNEQITEVYYNVDKALESMAENQVYQGASYQKYVINASNSLADFLARILDNMQQSMMGGQGQGKGEGFQLPDIIQSQQQLQEKMNGKGQSSGQQSSGSGQSEGSWKGEGKDGEKGNQGQVKQGDKGQSNGNEGENEKSQGKGNNGKGGSKGDGKEGSGGTGLGEAELQEIFEIYKEQQKIRRQLEEQLQNLMNSEDKKLGERLVKQMEDFENDLLQNGITYRTNTKINQIQHQLMKLENATLKQGRDSKRESNTSKSEFTNPILTRPSFLDNYNDQIEILNRQALPLRQNFQNRVKDYFKADD